MGGQGEAAVEGGRSHKGLFQHTRTTHDAHTRACGDPFAFQHHRQWRSAHHAGLPSAQPALSVVESRGNMVIAKGPWVEFDAFSPRWSSQNHEAKTLACISPRYATHGPTRWVTWVGSAEQSSQPICCVKDHASAKLDACLGVLLGEHMREDWSGVDERIWINERRTAWIVISQDSQRCTYDSFFASTSASSHNVVK